MCGICGVIDWSESPDAPGIVRRMTPTMKHRGPDDEGISDFGMRNSDWGLSAEGEGQRVSERRVSIGMRRLSIIDVEGGHQPMFNADRTVAAELNGEIYNFQSLQQQLRERGHVFHTRSDSEVVAHAYEEWGAECVEKFEGMFAVAVWDGRAGQEAGGGTLFLARDRMGIKPLYYYAGKSKQQTGNGDQLAENRKCFLFASEVRTILASGVVGRRLSPEALESYLLFGSVSEPMTLVEGVLSIPPGHRMTVTYGTSVSIPQPEPYWTIPGRTTTSGNGYVKATDIDSAAVKVRELLEASVRKHLIADVPVGVFLSGGIDSTALAGLAAKESAGIHTFTVAFAEEEFSEADIARRTAATLGTTHQEVMLTGGEMLARMDQAVSSLDQPSMDGINTYFVSQAAREAGLKVTLSGLGGDEVFGGYETFARTPTLEKIGGAGGKMPRRVREAVASVAGGAAGMRARGDVVRKMTALWNDSASLPHPYFFGRALFTPLQVSELLTKQSGKNGNSLWWNWLSDSAARSRNFDQFSAVTCLESQSYLVNTLLRDTDSMSMAHSLEVRVPFLDHPLVEFVTQLPQELKLQKGRTKSLLVRALSDLLPVEVLGEKRGFTFPWSSWLQGPLKERLDEGFDNFAPALREAMNQESVKTIWRDYLSGKTSWSRPWSLYVLNEWVKRNLS